MSFFETTPAGRILNRFSRFVSPLILCYGGRPQRLSKILIAYSGPCGGLVLQDDANMNVDSDIYRVDEVLARTFNMVCVFVCSSF